MLKNKIRKKVKIIIDDYKLRRNYKVLSKIHSSKKIGRFGVINFNSFKNINKKNLEKYFTSSEKDPL